MLSCNSPGGLVIHVLRARDATPVPLRKPKGASNQLNSVDVSHRDFDADGVRNGNLGYRAKRGLILGR